MLNDNEINELRKFASNDLMVQAVKKVLLADIYDNGTLEAGKEPEMNRNWVFGLVMDNTGQNYKQSNEELGEKLRACVEGIRTVQLAFKKLEEYKIVDIPIKENTNEAR